MTDVKRTFEEAWQVMTERKEGKVFRNTDSTTKKMIEVGWTLAMIEMNRRMLIILEKQSSSELWVAVNEAIL